MERTVIITGTHQDGTTMTHKVLVNDDIKNIAWTIELMRQCGYHYGINIRDI